MELTADNRQDWKGDSISRERKREIERGKGEEEEMGECERELEGKVEGEERERPVEGDLLHSAGNQSDSHGRGSGDIL